VDAIKRAKCTDAGSASLDPLAPVTMEGAQIRVTRPRPGIPELWSSHPQNHIEGSVIVGLGRHVLDTSLYGVLEPAKHVD